jgi:S-adenosylmethionine:tRNA ribosyltransferase-isomerase
MPQDLYSYLLPPKLIAQTPAHPRDLSKLLVIDKNTGALSHHIFRELPELLKPTDVLVFNNTKVFPARLHGTKSSGGHVEVLLLKEQDKGLWEVISHPGLKPGQTINFAPNFSAVVLSANVIKLTSDIQDLVSKYGHTPLPPYIHSSSPEALLRKQYQTVYAKKSGSAAAPTAGLHFTPRLLQKLKIKNLKLEYLTLHVGLGTFKSPTPDQIASGRLHNEYFELSPAVAARLNTYKLAGRRIIAVGTTTTRVLESCADPLLTPKAGFTDIFIQPPYKFKFVDGLITNFHLPKTSLLMLVSALSSWPIIRNAYQEAVSQNYRFFSFGDACLII